MEENKVTSSAEGLNLDSLDQPTEKPIEETVIKENSVISVEKEPEDIKLVFQGKVTLEYILSQLNGINASSQLLQVIELDDQKAFIKFDDETLNIEESDIETLSNLKDSHRFIYNFSEVNEYGQLIKVFGANKFWGSTDVNNDMYTFSRLKIKNTNLGRIIALMLGYSSKGFLETSEGLINYDINQSICDKLLKSEIKLNKIYPEKGYIIADARVITVSYIRNFIDNHKFKIISPINHYIYIDTVFHTKEQIETYMKLQVQLNTANENMEKFINSLNNEI